MRAWVGGGICSRLTRLRAVCGPQGLSRGSRPRGGSNAHGHRPARPSPTAPPAPPPCSAPAHASPRLPPAGATFSLRYAALLSCAAPAFALLATGLGAALGSHAWLLLGASAALVFSLAHAVKPPLSSLPVATESSGALAADAGGSAGGWLADETRGMEILHHPAGLAAGLEGKN